MGVSLEIYRARVGCFLQTRCPKPRRTRSKYNPYTRGSDVHLRAFVVCIAALYIYSSMLAVVAGHAYVMKTYAVHSLDSCWAQSTAPFEDHQYTTSINTCDQQSNLYSSFYQRRLLLAADVELNPGPTEDTQIILNALEKTNAEMRAIKEEVIGVRSEVKTLKDDISSIKLNIADINEGQAVLKISIEDMEKRIDDIELQNETIYNDIGSMSMRNEIDHDRLNKIDSHINNLESEKVKCSMRIFGLQENESNSSLNSLINDELLSLTNGEYTESVIVSSKRVGSASNGNPRMVIITFQSPDVKFKLFSLRNELRDRQIRVSNDLTFYQRQQLKDLNAKGLSGYFVKGKLVTYRKGNVNGNRRNRVFVHANRPSARNIAPMETVHEEAENGNL